MRVDWDRRKAEINLEKHGVSFEEAATVLYEPLTITFPDPDHSEGELRLVTYGYSSRNRLLVVANAEAGDVVRIISARQMTAHERKRYESQYPRA